MSSQDQQEQIHSQGSSKVDDDRSQADSDEENLEDVDASVEDLVKNDEGYTLTFGRTLFDQSGLDELVRLWIVDHDQVRVPDPAEANPELHPDECIVFQDLFTAGLRFPCQDFLEDVLKAFKIQMHHLTPNGVVRLAQFVWAVKSLEANADIGAFCELFEMHTQYKTFELDNQVITKYFGCCSFKTACNAVQISLATKNNLADGKWSRYWFYHKVPMVEDRDPATKKMVKKYPLASKMVIENFELLPSLPPSMISKTAVKAYRATTSLQCARDIVEEYVAARIWPLKKGWAFLHFFPKKIRGINYKYPDRDFCRPAIFSSDEEFVKSVESRADDLLGKYLQSEKNNIDKILGPDYKRLNRVFEVAEVDYGERPPPAYAREKKQGKKKQKGANVEAVNKVEAQGKNKRKAAGAVSKVVAKKTKKNQSPFVLLDADEIDVVLERSLDIKGNLVSGLVGAGEGGSEAGASKPQRVEDEVRKIGLIFFLVV